MALTKKIGNLYCFWPDINGRPRLCIGPHWNFFVCLMTSILVLACIFIFWIGPEVSMVITVVGVLVFGFLIGNYLLVALVNPGIVQSEYTPVDDDESLQERKYCSKCAVYMEPKVEHCEDCEVCIFDYDHHCPWTTKCVGRGNICYFYGFLVGILVAFIYTAVLLSLQSHNLNHKK